MKCINCQNCISCEGNKYDNNMMGCNKYGIMLGYIDGEVVNYDIECDDYIQKKGGNNMKPIQINNKWYINLSFDDNSYTLLSSFEKESEPICFKNNQDAIRFIKSLR